MVLNVNAIASNALTCLNDWAMAEFKIIVNTWDLCSRIPVQKITSEYVKMKLQPASDSYRYYVFFCDAKIFTLSHLSKTSHHTFKIDDQIFRIVGSNFIHDAGWSKGLCYLENSKD